MASSGAGSERVKLKFKTQRERGVINTRFRVNIFIFRGMILGPEPRETLEPKSMAKMTTIDLI